MHQTQSSTTALATYKGSVIKHELESYKEFVTDRYHIYFDLRRNDVIFHQLGSVEYYLVLNKEIPNNTLQYFLHQEQKDLNSKVKICLDVFCGTRKDLDRRMTFL